MSSKYGSVSHLIYKRLVDLRTSTHSWWYAAGRVRQSLTHTVWIFFSSFCHLIEWAWNALLQFYLALFRMATRDDISNDLTRSRLSGWPLWVAICYSVSQVCPLKYLINVKLWCTDCVRLLWRWPLIQVTGHTDSFSWRLIRWKNWTRNDWSRNK